MFPEIPVSDLSFEIKITPFAPFDLAALTILDREEVPAINEPNGLPFSKYSSSTIPTIL